jgi:glycosyltransferase involved in cell wall biosynthesis
MAAAEAMAAGSPVLLSNGVSISRSAVAAGAGLATGLAVPEISAAWSGMLDDPENLRRMGARGRAFVEREYEPGAIARKMLRVYENVICQRA